MIKLPDRIEVLADEGGIRRKSDPHQDERAASHVILLLDNNVGWLERTSLLLRNEGYRVATSGCIEEAEDRLRKIQISLVIINNRVPELHGIDFLKIAKAESPSVLTFLLTNHLDRRIIAALRSGALSMCLTRPIKDSLLMSMVNDALKKEIILSLKP